MSKRDTEQLAKDVAEHCEYDVQKFCKFLGDAAGAMRSKDRNVVKSKIRMVKALGAHMVDADGRGYYATADVDGTDVQIVVGGDSVAVSPSLADRMIRDHAGCFEYEGARQEKGDGGFKTGMLKTQ